MEGERKREGERERERERESQGTSCCQNNLIMMMNICLVTALKYFQWRRVSKLSRIYKRR